MCEVFLEFEKKYYLCTPFSAACPLKSFENIGEVVEWSITAVLKTVELKGSGGSNPSLSATVNGCIPKECGFFVHASASSLARAPAASGSGMRSFSEHNPDNSA